MKTFFNPRITMLLGIILLSGVWRIFIASEHSPLHNFTPIGAMAIFGGCYFLDKKKAFLVPIITLWLSDIILNYMFYYHKFVLLYDGFVWTYAAFGLMVFIGMAIKKVTIKNVLVAGITAALLHWLITDFGVWLARGIDITTGKPYTNDFYGLLKCYILALPYLKNMMLGNIVFCAIMFGAIEFAQNKFPALAPGHQ